MSKLFTIGYEGINIDQFISQLKSSSIRQLADVRAVALSRKPGFSKTKLNFRLANEGIHYEHFRALGDPKPGREAARSGNFELFRKIYREHLGTEDAQSALQNLVSYAKERQTCLLCYERDPKTCHRSIVAKSAIAHTGQAIIDLFVENSEDIGSENAPQSRRYHSQGITAP